MSAEPKITRQYLQWYRDVGRGQEACDAYKAEEAVEGWPIARLDFKDEEEQNRIWRELLANYQINATTVYT